MITIRLDIVPPTATAQQKGVFVRNGRAHFFTKAKVREAENFLASLLAGHVPAEPMTGAVELRAIWIYPYRKSEKRANVNARILLPHTSRPDLDNLEKGLLDTLTHLRFWLDDSQVAQKRTVKAWGPRPGLIITIREVKPIESECTAIGEDGEITHDGFEPWRGKHAAIDSEVGSDV